MKKLVAMLFILLSCHVATFGAVGVFLTNSVSGSVVPGRAWFLQGTYTGGSSGSLPTWPAGSWCPCPGNPWVGVGDGFGGTIHPAFGVACSGGWMPDTNQPTQLFYKYVVTTASDYSGTGEHVIFTGFAVCGEAAEIDMANACQKKEYWLNQLLWNNDSVANVYGAFHNGVPAGHYVMLCPGQTFNFAFAIPLTCDSSDTNGWTVNKVNFAETAANLQCGVQQDTNFGGGMGGQQSGGGWSTPTNPGTNPGPPGTTPSSPPAPNSGPAQYNWGDTNMQPPITFVTNNTPVDQASVQQGFQTLADLIAKGNAANQINFDNLDEDVLYGGNMASNSWKTTQTTGNGISNAVVQNTLSTSNMLSIANTRLLDITNWLKDIDRVAGESTNWLKGSSNSAWAGVLITSNLWMQASNNDLRFSLSDSNFYSLASNNWVGASNDFRVASLSESNSIQQMTLILSNVIFNGGSNGVAVSVTVSNLALTNEWHGAFTNAPSLDGMGTNYVSAKAIADDTIGPLKSVIDGIVSALTPYDPGDGNETAISVPIGTYTMHVSPFEGEWSNVWSTMRSFLAWVLVIGYLTKISMDSYKFVNVAGAAQQMRIPNINAEVLGIGGNWGAVLVPVLLTAFLIATGVLLGFLATWLTNSLSYFLIVSSNPFSGASGSVSLGLNWFYRACPVALMFGLSVSYIIFRLSMTTVVGVFVLIVRSLPG